MIRTRGLSALVAVAALATAVLPLQPISAQPNDSLPNRVVIPTAIPTAMLPAIPSIAPGYQAPRVEPSAATIVGVTEQPFVNISLQDAIAMALLKNPNLAVSASNVKVARYTIVQAKGQYDVQLHLEPYSSSSVNPPQNLFEAGPGEVGKYGSGPSATYTAGPGNVIQHQSGFQYGAGGQTENGTTYQAGIQQQRVYNNTIFNEYNPYYLATLNLGVTQPLLRNAGMNSGKRLLKLSMINADASSAQALVDTSNTIAGAYCSKLLTDLGADVVFERAIDDPLFTYLRTSQRHIRDIDPWKHRADIVIVGTTELRRKSFAARDPLVYTRISAVGYGGPDDGLVCPEEVLQSRSGSLANHGHADLPPLTVAGNLGEYAQLAEGDVHSVFPESTMKNN